MVEGNLGKAALSGWSKLSSNAQCCEDFLYRGWDEFDQHYNSIDPHTRRQVRSSHKKQYSPDEIARSWNNFSPLFDHYFRTTFSIFNELERLLGNDHWRYAKLFRAQLSRDELTLLAFNLLFDDEGKKMQPLVCKYGLLKHLADTKLRDHAITQLDPKAFGSAWVTSQRHIAPLEHHHAA